MKLLIAEVVWTWSAKAENPEWAKLFSKDVFLTASQEGSHYSHWLLQTVLREVYLYLYNNLVLTVKTDSDK